MNTPHPDLAIIVQGSDPYEKDELPSASLLKLSKEEMLERDIFLYQFLKDKNIPQAYLMSGGYGQYAYEIYCQFLQAILTT
jgi:acetoin utilization deacetylase AcuC-like enzyme